MNKQNDTKIEMMDFQSLHLDNERNPRLPSRLMGKSETAILEYMVAEASLIDLMLSIGEKGFFNGEPLLVVEKDGGNYCVVEGNRRLSAVILLNDPHKIKTKHKMLLQIASEAKNIPIKLPVVIFHERKAILDYLGYRHITGIKPWDSLAKARYVKELFENSPEKDTNRRFAEIAKTIGSGNRVDYTRKLLCAYSIYLIVEKNRYFGIRDLSEESISFSLITTALGYEKINEFLNLKSSQEYDPQDINIDNLKELMKWMFEKEGGKTRLGESRNLGQLAAVIGSSVAIKEFRSGATLDAAYYFSDGAKQSVVNGITEAHRYLELAYKYAKDVTLEDNYRDTLNEIKKTAEAIKKQTTPSDD